MHHYIRAVVVFAVQMERLAAEEDAGVRVHGCLVWRDRSIELPHDDRFRVVEEIVADAGDMLDEGDVEAFELGAGADARQK